MLFILETVFIEKFKLHLASQFLKAHLEGPCLFSGAPRAARSATRGQSLIPEIFLVFTILGELSI